MGKSEVPKMKFFLLASLFAAASEAGPAYYGPAYQSGYAGAVSYGLAPYSLAPYAPYGYNVPIYHHANSHVRFWKREASPACQVLPNGESQCDQGPTSCEYDSEGNVLACI